MYRHDLHCFINRPAGATVLGWFICLLVAGTAYAGEPSPGHSVGFWHWQTPSSTDILVLFLVLVLTSIIGFGLYRALLRNQVKQGVHPHVLGWTLGFLVAGINLYVMFALLFASTAIGLGIPAVLFGLFLFLVIVMLVLGKIGRWIIFFLLLIAALVAFQVLSV